MNRPEDTVSGLLLIGLECIGYIVLMVVINAILKGYIHVT